MYLDLDLLKYSAANIVFHHAAQLGVAYAIYSRCHYLQKLILVLQTPIYTPSLIDLTFAQVHYLSVNNVP